MLTSCGTASLGVIDEIAASTYDHLNQNCLSETNGGNYDCVNYKDTYTTACKKVNGAMCTIDVHEDEKKEDISHTYYECYPKECMNKDDRSAIETSIDTAVKTLCGDGASCGATVDCDYHKISGGGIAAIIIVVLLCLGLAGWLGFMYVKRKGPFRSRTYTAPTNAPSFAKYSEAGSGSYQASA